MRISETADIVLLLISPDFKASQYCVEKEMKRALEREKEGSTYVIPILFAAYTLAECALSLSENAKSRPACDDYTKS